MGRIIGYDRSIIIACDVSNLREMQTLVKDTCDVRGVGGYKIGSVLSIAYGLPMLVKMVRNYTDLPIIYDHQKAMTDIPELGVKVATVVRDSGVQGLIGFPQAGPATQEQWIKACREVDLEVLIGGEMTHERYKRSEGGYIADEALDQIYMLAANLGVTNFVVPGTKEDRVAHYKEILCSIPDLTFYAPGFVAQGGLITSVGRAAGPRWHAIIGRAIYEAGDVHAATVEMTKQLFD